MRVTTRFFGILRQQAGVDEACLDLEDGATVLAAYEALTGKFPALGRHIASIGFAVNLSYVKPDHPLGDNDELALIPPVSGGAGRVVVTGDALDTARISASARSLQHGANVVFQGVVRDDNAGRRVISLEYEAYTSMAEAETERILVEAESKWTPLCMAVWHRTGRLAVGETSLVVAVGAPHRREAFLACSYIVDQIKLRVPIWEKEIWDTGSEWIGSAATA